MFRLSAFALLSAAAVLSTLAVSAPTMQIREQAIETTTFAASLPASSTGSMIVKPCATCPTLTLRLTGASRFRIGQEDVSFAQLATALRGATGARSLYIYYELPGLNITRIVTRGAAIGSLEPRPRVRDRSE